jgi:hypothetical protein
VMHRFVTFGNSLENAPSTSSGQAFDSLRTGLRRR